MVALPGTVASAVVTGVSVVAAVVSAVDVGTGLSSCGAVDDTADWSSFAGTVGGVSSEAGVGASFLPKILPKIEPLLFGFGAVSRALEAEMVSPTADSAPATGAEPKVPTAVLVSPAGTTGSPITRDAMSSQTVYNGKGIYWSTDQQPRRQIRRSWPHPVACLPSTPASRLISQPCLRA